MSKKPILSAKVIGQISLMQSVITLLPDQKNILKFVCHGMKDIPGVKMVDYHFSGSRAFNETTTSKTNSKKKLFTIEIHSYRFGVLLFELTDEPEFLPYVPYVKNFCNVLAVTFNEREQRKQNEALLAGLEQRVQERTKELQVEIERRKQTEENQNASVQQLQASEQQLRASNQQLDASIQQLQATEQQLRVANQQLEANNQQLLASEQQLRAANQEIQVSEARFKEAEHIARMGNFTWEIPTGKVTWSEGLHKMLGFDTSEDLNYDKVNAEIHHPEDLERITTWLNECIASGKSNFAPNEYRLVCKDGTIIHVQTSIKVLRENNVPFKIIGTALDITQRKKAEEKLKESEEKFRMAFQKHPDAINITTIADGEIIEINPGFTRITGYSLEESMGKKTSDLELWANPGDRAEMVRRLKEYGSISDFEFLRKMKDGSIKDSLMYVTPITINNTSCLLSIIRDVYEQKQAERKLIKSEDRLSMAMLAANDGLWDWDLQTNNVYFDARYYQMAGYKVNEFSHRLEEFQKRVHPDDMDRVMKMAQKNFTGELKRFNTEFRFKKKNSDWMWILGRAVIVERDEQGHALRFVGTHTDITKRKKAEDELHKLSTAVKQSPSLILITDTDGKLEYVNPKCIALTGYSFEESIGKNLRLLKSGKQSNNFYKNLWKTISSGEVWQGDIQNKKKNGEFYWESAHIVPIKDLNGTIVNYVKIAEDITERKETEIELVKAKEKAEESDRLKSAFLSNMSHEIRTPMNGILGFTQLLKEPQLTGEEKEQFITIIEKSGNRMLNTINDIIDIAKIEAGQVKAVSEEVSVNQILEEQYYFFNREAQAKGLELNYRSSLSDKDARIFTDHNKLEGILTNLIKNAIKFTEKGSITLGCVHKKNKVDDVLEFYVKDTGIGIPASRIEAVFNRFEQADIADTRAFQGSGLGLAIAKSYVEMLGGEIKVSSKEGKGSTFSFSIPYEKSLAGGLKSNENIHNDSLKPLSDLSVIVAEDDEVSKLYLKTILENEVNTISYTCSGQETIDRCRENPDVDIILMDIKMPDINGYEATAEIRKFNKDVLIIAQTSFGLSGDSEKALAAGCNDYIAKPIQKELLMEKIWMCLERKV